MSKWDSVAVLTVMLYDALARRHPGNVHVKASVSDSLVCQTDQLQPPLLLRTTLHVVEAHAQLTTLDAHGRVASNPVSSVQGSHQASGIRCLASHATPKWQW